MECAQHIEAAGKRDDEAAIARHLLAWTFIACCCDDLVDKGRASK
jgi:hypothetical protein